MRTHVKLDFFLAQQSWCLQTLIPYSNFETVLRYMFLLLNAAYWRSNMTNFRLFVGNDLGIKLLGATETVATN